MYIQNRRDGSKFKGCSPLQLLNGLTSIKPAIAYFAYTTTLGQISGGLYFSETFTIFVSWIRKRNIDQ
jgi:hypothetical protein